MVCIRMLFGAAIFLFSFSQSNAVQCSKFWTAPPPLIINKYNKDDITGNGTSSTYSPGTKITLKCVSSTSHTLKGPQRIICRQNGTWDSNSTNCEISFSRRKSDSPSDLEVIGGSVGCGVGIIILVIAIVGCTYMRRKNRKNRTSGDKVAQSNRRRLSEPIDNFRHSLHADNTYTNIMDNGVDNMYHPSQRHHNMSFGSNYGYRSTDDISVIGSNASIIGTSNVPIFKVWTCRRTRRKFIRADSLAMLLKKASIIYQYNNPIKVTLEEDGTQIDSDDSLMACVGKTLVVLNGNEQWRDLDGHSNFPIKRYTFEVCPHDRSLKTIILAENLRDLMYQASTYFGYSVKEVCLEGDGTCIDDDDILLKISSQTLMVLGVYHAWAPETTDGLSPDSIRVKSDTAQPKQMRDVSFKIWSDDMTKKKIIKADNSIDLHMKAAKALGLEMPVQIKVKDEDTVISTDILMQSNVGKILIVTQPGVTKWSRDNTIQYESKSNDYAKVIRKHDLGNEDFENEPAFPYRHETKTNVGDRNDSGYPEQRNIHSAYRRSNSSNEPDIVFSPQVPETMPSRYMSPELNDRTAGPLPVDKRSSNEAGRFVPREQNRPVNTPYTGYFDEQSIQKRNVPSSFEDHYTLVPDERVKQKPSGLNYEDRPSTSQIPFRQGKTDERKDPQGNLYPNLDTKKTSAYNYNDKHDLPYSDLSPSYQLNSRNKQTPQRASYDDPSELPYSDLAPSHKPVEKRQPNNFDMMRKGESGRNSQPEVYNHDNRPLKLNSNTPFMVSGGAAQSRHSDVLF